MFDLKYNLKYPIMKSYNSYFKWPLYLLLLLITNNLFGQSVASYDITFTSFWNSSDHGTLPSNAHWSSLVGATHKTANEFLEVGNKASLGIEMVAEDGVNTTFQTEVNTNADANQYINGGGLASGLGTISIQNLQVSEDFPLLTLVSMIAPSPDWFITANSINLRSGNIGINNGWKDTFTIDLFPYDAGTEEGNSYAMSNPATNPQENISSLINVAPFNANKIGTMTFTYNSSTLSSKGIEGIEIVTIYPNPSPHGKITISNIKNIDLNSVTLYDVYGKQIKQITPDNKTAKLEMDVSNLPSTLYLLSLMTTQGNSKTFKLVLQ